MAAEFPSDDSTEHRDYTAIIILAVLGILEVAILYMLIAVESPVTPVVRRLLRNPPGVFALVMIVVTSLFFGMAGFLAWAQWLGRRRAMTDAPSPTASAPPARD